MADYQEMLGKLVADEMKKMQSEDAGFDPRNGHGPEVDEVTASILKNLVEPQQQGQGYDAAIKSNPDMKYIVDSLMRNPLIIPYVAAWLDEKLEKMTEDLKALFASTFPSENPPNSNPPPAS